MLIYNVGINDADYPTKTWESKGTCKNRKRTETWSCPFYTVWFSMLARCYSKVTQAKQPEYIGCSVSDDWLIFSNFKKWMKTQNFTGMQLDKDLLIDGNKLYSADTCLFLEPRINKFLIAKNKNIMLPLGVCYHKASGKLYAQCSNPFNNKREYLGLFLCPTKAHIAWKSKKHEHACALADTQTDVRIIQALRRKYNVYL